mmetsp:Transcript_34643/g.79006  ORF Transcript_34643/g.79006 Transcript_34643/m.79006 type:complete len:389 (-) Transcript_34643:35-1201(-)
MVRRIAVVLFLLAEISVCQPSTPATETCRASGSSVRDLSVIGFGSVGQVVCEQAVSAGVRVHAVADSSTALVGMDSSGFSLETLTRLADFKKLGRSLREWTGPEAKVALAELVPRLPQGSVLADCSASDSTAEILMAAQMSGFPVVLANKKPLTGIMAQFRQLTNDRSLVRFESTVGAGLPVITSLRRILDSGDRVIQIEGQLSGTLGYILSELQNGSPFSDIVLRAKGLGFTEPDPRDDLSGTDVARKALILSRCMGLAVELDAITVEPLFPSEMASLSVNEFLARLPELDESMLGRVTGAKERGNRLRYAAVVTSSHINVGLVEVGPDNALFSLSGTDNLVSIKTEWYTQPLVISGPGAGLNVTAGGVLADVIDLAGSSLKARWGN